MEILLFPSPWPLTLLNLTPTLAHTMTIFVVSHNLQVTSARVPALSAVALAEALKDQSNSFTVAEPLNHPHWLIRLESALDANAMAHELVKAWKGFRHSAGHACDHDCLALGGRKDTPGSAGSPLQEGAWGVDVVECAEPDQFLVSINWEGLKGGRPSDAIFEVKG
ncbi:DUF2656 family protein [Synechococcus sp. BIOS-U3-1]|uniref:DUF2656 family protein n=1 Tax=Synechococcus sp. BIOS-U3-1 TaxID=1400865 RepID=UPI00351C4CD7